VTAVLTLPPSTRASDAPRAPRRRAGRGATALVAAVLLLGGLLWSAVLWAPSTAEVAAGATRFAGSAGVATVPEYGLRGTHIVPYDEGADLTITVPVRNEGPLPLTVTSAATGAGVLPLVEVRAVDGLPLRLLPGQEGEVVLQAVLANCAYYHEREIQNVDGLVLGADVGVGPLSRATTLTVPLDSPILVKSPMIVKCPDRKINRQADNRSDAL
jgi:hypothetical protein